MKVVIRTVPVQQRDDFRLPCRKSEACIDLALLRTVAYGVRLVRLWVVVVLQCRTPYIQKHKPGLFNC